MISHDDKEIVSQSVNICFLPTTFFKREFEDTYKNL